MDENKKARIIAEMRKIISSATSIIKIVGGM